MADEEYESVVCVKNEVQIYRIPPRTTNRGYRLARFPVFFFFFLKKSKNKKKKKNLKIYKKKTKFYCKTTVFN